MATTPAEPLSSRLFCTECGRPFPPEDLARFGTDMVCAECKPRFVQRLREGAPTAMTVVYGGFWRRFLAVLIDSVILMILNLPFAVILGLFVGLAGTSRNSARVGGALLGLEWLFGIAIAVTYTAYFLSQKGATPGKMIMRLKVITATGGPISVGRAVGRYFANLLSAAILYVGYLMAAFDSQKRALHDHICSTRVIQV
jgi:uncharacterized RDD family membrane protein YckC